MAAAALVIFGVILVMFGMLAQFSVPIIGLGVLALIAAGILRVLMSRRT
jgi:hypothetical protein